ncbi:Holliday junction branch migration protein RuvA [Candidatus Gottesmanbacteria bacterium]|nr:Holliday junction branch migration protein RuvA [Candidatus Gottesmanbacteria bacterium]
MIGALKGPVQITGSNTILLFAGAVGYKVFVNSKLIESITKNKDDILLYTHTHVAENILELYGFKSREELALFELLIDVSGVGPKTALAILERGEKEIREAIIASDVAFFTTIPRIGNKNAQRIIIDLKSKIGSLSDLDLTGKSQGQTAEVIEALTAMGFKRFEVNDIINKLPKDLVTTEAKIKAALKMLG